MCSLFSSSSLWGSPTCTALWWQVWHLCSPRMPSLATERSRPLPFHVGRLCLVFQLIRAVVLQQLLTTQVTIFLSDAVVVIVLYACKRMLAKSRRESLCVHCNFPTLPPSSLSVDYVYSFAHRWSENTWLLQKVFNSKHSLVNYMPNSLLILVA